MLVDLNEAEVRALMEVLSVDMGALGLDARMQRLLVSVRKKLRSPAERGTRHVPTA